MVFKCHFQHIKNKGIMEQTLKWYSQMRWSGSMIYYFGIAEYIQIIHDKLS